MKQRFWYISALLFAVIYLNIPIHVSGWGFFAHRKINELAVFTLHSDLFGFYKKNIQYVSDHAVDADKRRYAVPNEGPKHFLDADHYENSIPLDSIPQKWQDAVEKYTEDTLMKYGILPWNIEWVLTKLTNAFKEKNLYLILKYSSDMGHYIGDLHVPLHTTGNYNGQKTNQHGIHGLWESRLPELFAENYDFVVGKASYVEFPREVIWQALNESHALVDSVLKTELKVSKSMDEELKYSFEQRGSTTVKTYSKTFCKAYHEALGNMVEDRMKKAIKMLGDFWLTAWVNAGQPDLGGYETLVEIPEEDEEEKKKTEKEFKKGQIIGRPEPNE
jgi:hypothetical protein